MKTILKNLVDKIQTAEGVDRDSIYENIEYESTQQIETEVSSDGYWMDISFEVETFAHYSGGKTQELNYVDVIIWEDGDEVSLSDDEFDYLFELLKNKEW